MTLLEDIKQYEQEHPHTSGTCETIKRALYDVIVKHKPERVIEIGVSRGAVTAYLAAALEENGKGRLISVDNWSQNFGGKADGPAAACHRVDALGLKERVRFVSQDSQRFLAEQKDNSAGLVWVDGDHSYEGAKADVIEAIRISNTVVGVHDTSHGHHKEDIRRVIRELGIEGQGEYIEERHGCWLGEI